MRENTMKMFDYFVACYRLDRQDGYLIWAQDEKGQDRVLLDDSGRVLIFPQADQALAYIADNAFPPAEDSDTTIFHDLDAVRDWLIYADPDRIDCPGFLDVWNLFADVSMALADHSEFVPRTDLNQAVYRKLFRGCNIPMITAPGDAFTPEWTPEDVAELHRTLDTGLRLFTENLGTG